MAALLSVLSMMFTLLSPLPRSIAQNASGLWASGWVASGKRLAAGWRKSVRLTVAALARVGAALHAAAFRAVGATFHDLDRRLHDLFALTGLGLIPNPP